MSKNKQAKKVKPKIDKQTVDGLEVSFEEAMKVLSKPKVGINKKVVS